MDFSKISNVYMIGIKGVGMTMLAEYLVSKGIFVSGSDVDEKFMTDEVLRKAGINVIEKFDVLNIDKKADLVIHSSAYNALNNVEVANVMESSMKVMNYAKAVSEVFNDYFGIGVVGSHGKTTTTAWLGYVVNESGMESNVMVGARVPQFDGNCVINSSSNMIAELDEYQNKFQFVRPNVVLLNNIDYDHPDFFPTRDDYVKVFIDLIKRIPKSGVLIANGDDEESEKVVRVNTTCRVVRYAIRNDGADYVASDIKQVDGRQYFNVRSKEGDLGSFNIMLTGEHNVLNALAVIAACIELEIDLLSIRSNLAEFSGTARRMEVLGEFNRALIIDDYAHHPTEVKATLAGARRAYRDKNLICVFHPHTFTRTKALLSEFAGSFVEADKVIVLDIYGSAREEQGGVSSSELVERIVEFNQGGVDGEGLESGLQEVMHIKSLGECEDYLRSVVGAGDVVLLMGAGDVFRIGEGLIE